ncbi:restriction endonuclease subunit S [Dorea sp. OM07-5]|uniref:restriction endonuclease subunit S n=1 Tax=Dorea sp. OM07-5 TaxID=2293100 RepID=UPI000E4878D7|nr:restriction endonuclease subunit S [Dorea sp. OM07-5]RHU95245.1 restriction endonuclease subunit S [Dorea sp. OM07-5]
MRIKIDGWEQRKLNEIADKVSEKNKNNEFSEPFTNSAEQGIISQKDYFDREIVNNENLNGYYIVRNDDFIYNPRISVTAPVGPINRNRLGRNGVMSPLYTVFRTHDIDNLYLEFYFKTTRWHRFMKLNGDSGARFDRFTISSTQFMEMPIPYPTLEEQQKIGEYFESLDHLITLHQRKCEQTKTLKKYMLQKMFPQDGEKVPQIRFEGFTEDWEQRKLGDLVDRVTRKNQDLVSELPLTISAQYGLIDQNEFFDKRVASKDVSGYYLIENGEFAYNKSTSTDAPWGAIKRLDRYENGVLSTLYIIFGIKENNPVDSDFLVSYYSTNLWHKGIHEIAAEGARNHGLLNIAPADFFATRLMIPQDIEEQKKIGKYFIELEALITLHQRKCMTSR